MQREKVVQSQSSSTSRPRPTARAQSERGHRSGRVVRAKGPGEADRACAHRRRERPCRTAGRAAGLLVASQAAGAKAAQTDDKVGAPPLTSPPVSWLMAHRA